MSLFKRQHLSTLPQLPLFSQLNEEMNRFFEPSYPSLEWGQLGGQWQPDLDVEEKDKEYVIHADVPGVDASDLKVYLENGMLTIEGKRNTEVETKRDTFKMIERSYGNFYRAVKLAAADESKNIKAHCRNGVLEVKIPKLTTSKQKQIEIIAD